MHAVITKKDEAFFQIHYDHFFICASPWYCIGIGINNQNPIGMKWICIGFIVVVIIIIIINMEIGYAICVADGIDLIMSVFA